MSPMLARLLADPEPAPIVSDRANYYNDAALRSMLPRRRFILLRFDRPTPDCPVPAVRATIIGMVPRVTRCQLWEGDVPDVGEYLETRTGVAYVVLSVKPNTRANPKSVARVDMLRLEADELIDSSKRKHPFRWIGSAKRRSAR